MSIAILEAKAVNARIDAFQKSGKELDTEVHILAVSCLFHAEKHGDNTLATRLVHAMPGAGRTKALIYWFTVFGALKWSKDDKGVEKFLKDDKRTYRLEEAENTPFYSYTKEKNPKPFSLEDIIKSVQGKLKKAAEEGKLSVDSLNAFVKGMEGVVAQTYLTGKVK